MNLNRIGVAPQPSRKQVVYLRKFFGGTGAHPQVGCEMDLGSVPIHHVSGLVKQSINGYRHPAEAGPDWLGCLALSIKDG